MVMKPFPFSLLFALMWHILPSKCCPSDAYSQCATEVHHGVCTIPSTSKKGYLAYGLATRWTLIPFSNSQGSVMSVGCDGSLGDSFSGEDKECCLVTTDTQEILDDGFVGSDTYPTGLPAVDAYNPLPYSPYINPSMLSWRFSGPSIQRFGTS
eukprot:267206_1